MCFEPGLSALAEMMAECDLERFGNERYGAPRHSVFDFLGRRETALSSVLAYLFDPKEAHGQGAIFLNELLRVLGLRALSRNDEVRVRTEAPIPVLDRKTNRRIDILLESEHFVLGIENKLRTGEGIDQLGDYAAHLDRLGTALNRPARLLFVSSDEPSIPTAVAIPWFRSDSQGPSIDAILAAARPSIRALRISDFIDDLRGWIARAFGGTAPINGLEPYVNAMIDSLNDPEKARAIGAAIMAKDAVQERLIAGIEMQIRQALDGISDNRALVEPDERFVFGSALPDLQNHTLRDTLGTKFGAWCARRTSWPKNCFLAIQSDESACGLVNYGVLALDPAGRDAEKDKFAEWASEDIAVLNRTVDEVGSRQKRDEWWRWNRYAAQRDWSVDGIASALVLGKGKIGSVFEIDRLIADLVDLAKAIDHRNEARALESI